MPKSSNKSPAASGDNEASDHAAPSRRPAWSGSISFGLVSVPVELYSATRPRKLRARMLDASGAPVARRYFCPEDEKALDESEIVRGYELPNGEYVTVEDEELEALAPKKSREIDLRLFTQEDQLSPAWFDHAYVLVPGSEGGKAYRLLAEVMHRTRRVGIATFVMRGHEYIIAIFSDGHVLLGQTLRFADELRSPDELGLPESAKVPSALLDKFERLLTSGRGKRFDPESLIDPSHAKLQKLIEAKRKRGDVVQPAGTPATDDGGEGSGAEVIDLMQLLKNSLKSSKSAQPAADKPKRRKRS